MQRDVCVVVGVGGMGRAAARRLGSGRCLLLADRSSEGLEHVAETMLADGFDVTTAGVDVTSPRSVAALADVARALGPVTTLVHTAGVSPAQGEVAEILAVNALGPSLVLDAFVELMAPGGAAVVIVSNAGYMETAPEDADEVRRLRTAPTSELLDTPHLARDRFAERATAYKFAKKVAKSRAQAAATGWAAKGCRVNSVSPGVVSTAMGRAERASGNALVERLIASSPAGRVATAEEVADAVAFLLGPGATFITGADLLVDGGAVAAIESGQLSTDTNEEEHS